MSDACFFGFALVCAFGISWEFRFSHNYNIISTCVILPTQSMFKVYFQPAKIAAFDINSYLEQVFIYLFLYAAEP